MVQRCSNGVPFVVLEPEPSVRTGIRVEIYDGANPFNLLGILPDTFARRWQEDLRGPGSGSFSIYPTNPALVAEPTLLAYGNIARFVLDEVDRFAITIESKSWVQASPEGDVAGHIKVEGRGVLAKLEDAVAYPDGGLTGDVERTFTENAGAAILELIDEAHARGALVGVTYDFTPTTDSNNAPFAVPLEVTERAGTDLLRVAERHASAWVDVRMAPGLVLQYFNQRGIDRSLQLVDAGPVVFWPGKNVVELDRSEDGAIRNALLVETPAGFLERVESASITSHRRREGFLSLGNITNSDAVDRAATSVFQRSAEPAPQIGFEVLDVEGVRPYVDWSVGDWVLAPDEDADLTRYRVRSLTVDETTEGRVRFIPELATITEELEDRLERWLAAMAKGSLGGTAGDVAEPVKAPAEVVDAIAVGIDDHVDDVPHVDELSDLADVDVAGLTDGAGLAYDAGDAAWEPVARTLHDWNTDVDAETPVEGDMLYRADSGLWVPVSGTKAEGAVPTLQDTGAVAWEVPSGGGGGSVPASVLYLGGRIGGETGHDDDVFFDGSAPAGTDVDHGPGTFEVSEAFGVLSMRLAGASSLEAIYARAWPLTPNASPVTIETRVTLLPGHLINTGYGLAFGFSDGTATTSAIAGRNLRIESNGAETWNVGGTFASQGRSDGINDHFVHLGNPLYIRVGWTAADTFKANIGRNPVHFSAQTWASLSRTLTPTHFWVGIVSNQANQSVLTVDYIRVNEANLVT